MITIFSGRFLAEVTSQVFADLEASKYQVSLIPSSTCYFIPFCMFQFMYDS